MSDCFPFGMICRLVLKVKSKATVVIVGSKGFTILGLEVFTARAIVAIAEPVNVLLRDADIDALLIFVELRLGGRNSYSGVSAIQVCMIRNSN